MVILEIAKNEIWPKNIREIDVFDFTSFLACTFFKFATVFGLEPILFLSNNKICQISSPPLCYTQQCVGQFQNDSIIFQGEKWEV